MPIRITGLNSGLDTEAIISALVSSYDYKTEKYKKAQTKLAWKQEAWKSLNTKIYSFYKSVGNLRLSTAYDIKSTISSDSTKVTVSAGSGAPNGTQKLNVLQIAQAGSLTGAKLVDGTKGSTTLKDLGYDGSDAKFQVTVNGKKKEISVNADTTVNEVVGKLKDAGLHANFDEANGRFYVSARNTGKEGDFKIEGLDENGKKALKSLGLDTANGANKIDGQNAKIKLNGVEYEGSSNSFSINGLNLTVQGVTGDGDENAVTITTNTDTQAIYDKIKDFLTQYNALVNEMASLYNAETAKGYEPLSDEEKEAMSEAEIEKWEQKIKDSLLRRDDSLESVLNAMTSSMSQGIEIDGKTYYLSSFGINTLGYLDAPKNQHYAYHINGDEDDLATSGKEDKLMAAINSDPDTVVTFMQKLATNLYNSIDEKMKATSLRSTYTVYNDKEMASEYSDYTDLIKKWEEKLQKQEDYYYQKFAAMETALSKLNSQTSSLSQLFGG